MKQNTLANKVYRLKRESALLGLILCFAISNTTIKGQKLAFKQGVTEELKATDRLAGIKYSCKEGCFFPLFQTEKELRDILQKLYKETDVHAEGSMVYFHCVK